MSVRNISHHLDNLEGAGVVQVTDTRYPKKAKQMEVYAPADDPVVVFVGTETRKTGFIELLKRLVGATSLLLFGSVLLYIYHGFGLDAGGGNESGFGHCCPFPDSSSFSVRSCSGGSGIDRTTPQYPSKINFEPSGVLSLPSDKERVWFAQG